MSLTLILASKTQREKKSDSSTHSFRFISSPNYYYCQKREKDSTKFLSDCCTFSQLYIPFQIISFCWPLLVVFNQFSILQQPQQEWDWNSYFKSSTTVYFKMVEKSAIFIVYFLSNQQIFFVCVWCFSVLVQNLRKNSQILLLFQTKIMVV